MTTAARPTWAPAKGGNEARIFGSSQKYASRDLAARTTLRPRIGRGKFTVAAITADDYLLMRSTEVKNRHLVPFVLLDLSAELVLMVRECLHMDSMFPGTEADGAIYPLAEVT